MEQAVRHKAVSGMLWTGIDRLGTRLIQFIIEIIVARILLPSDYGLIGMLAIFMGIAQTFIDSGFSNALIQKKDRNEKDYSTVFYFSIIVSVIFYLVLFITAPLIATFYSQPVLTSIIKVYMLTLIINSFSISQTAKLTIDLNFKAQAKISIGSIIVSGAIGITLAFAGFGVWALVWQGIAMALTRTVFMWIASRWLPLLLFSKESFRRLFSFGGKLLASSLINNVYSNLSTIIIGKNFHSTDLGYFTRAQQFCQLPTQTITNIVLKVNYPILSQMQDDNIRLVESYKTLLRTPIFILYPILFGLALLSQPLIEVVLGDKWLSASSLLSILCIGCLWDPLTQINLNLLYVKGKTDLVLKLELIKKPLAFIMLLCSIPLGLNGMCWAISIYSFIAFCFNCYYTGKILNFGLWKQIKSLLPILGYCVLMSLGIALFILIFESAILKLTGGILFGIFIYVTISILFRDRSMAQLITIVKRK